MIEGYFDSVYGRPYVQGRLYLPRLRVYGNVDFLVDTGADTSRLHPRDATVLGVNYGQLLAPSGDPQLGIGGVEYPYQEEAVIIFQDSELLHSFQAVISIAAPNLHNLRFPSLLGQDVIQHLRMVHDKPRRRLEFSLP